mmetsp:Transcript_23303/g.40098  ORF Transcript_23303/g.40098 Transcript_23303/m.40098 type:complete len:90 (+) Transcript_23303:653-922(+)
MFGIGGQIIKREEKNPVSSVDRNPANRICSSTWEEISALQLFVDIKEVLDVIHKTAMPAEKTQSFTQSQDIVNTTTPNECSAARLPDSK